MKAVEMTCPIRLNTLIWYSEDTGWESVTTKTAKKIVKTIKESGIKVQASIMDEQVRVTGKKLDDLQTVIALIRKMPYDLPLQYINFRN